MPARSSFAQPNKVPAHARADVVDQVLEVTAIDGRVPKTTAPAVSVGIMPAATDLYDLARVTSVGEGHQPDLARDDRGMAQCFVELMVKDIEVRGGGSVVGRTKSIDLFEAASGIDDDHGHGTEADLFRRAPSTKDEVDRSP